jgi:hypothetical protein
MLSSREPARVLFPAYVAGGLLLVLGSALNPIGPALILTSGVSSGFAAMAGLAILPRVVEGRVESAGESTIATSVPWIVLGLVVAILFVGILGPGVRLS